MERTVKHALCIPNMIVGADASKIVEYAIVAEDTKGGCNPNECEDFIDPWISVAGIATRTERINLGTWITPLTRPQPWQVARDIATLDRRLELGTTWVYTGHTRD